MSSPASIARFLVRQRLRPFPLPTEPGFDPEARKLFERHLGEAKLYVEFGCGGSTMLASRLGVPTVSTESDRLFARRMRSALGADSSVRIIHADTGMTHAWGRPVFTRRTSNRLTRWRRYSAAPWEVLPDGSFPDFILVDGRFRRACALQAAKRAVAGDHSATLMFDDYFNDGRDHYRAIEQHLGQPLRVGRAAFFALNRQTGIPSEAELVEAASDPR